MLTHCPCVLQLPGKWLDSLKAAGTFMTNADVPSIAVSGLIDEPVNPVTGNDITKISLKNSVYGEYTDWDKPSSAEAYEQTRKALEAQGIVFEGGGR